MIVKMICVFSGLEMFFYPTTLLFSDGFKDQNEGNSHPFLWTDRNLEKSWASSQNTGILSKELFASTDWNFLTIFHYRETLDGQDDFFIKHVRATDGSEAFLFISPSLLENLGEVTELHADGTFRTVPPMFQQLFTLHFSRFGQVSCRFNLFKLFFTEFFSFFLFFLHFYVYSFIWFVHTDFPLSLCFNDIKVSNALRCHFPVCFGGVFRAISQQRSQHYELHVGLRTSNTGCCYGSFWVQNHWVFFSLFSGNNVIANQLIIF